MDCIAKYNSLVSSRAQYLNNADALADLVAPNLKPKASNSDFLSLSASSGASFQYEALNRPYSNAGTFAVSSLASHLQSLLVPPGFDWFEYSLPLDIQAKLPPEILDQAKSMTVALKQKTIDKMAEHGVYAEVGPALLRLLVEGNLVLHVTNEFMRCIPLRSFVVCRDNGKVDELIIEETYTDGDDEGGKTINLYTYVNYKTGKVYQQKTGQKDARRIDASPKQYIVVTSSMPHAGESYANAYGWNYYGTIKAINDLARDQQRIVRWLALHMLLIDPSSTITPQTLVNMINQGKDVISALPQEFSMFAPAAASGKLAEIQYISAAIAQLTNELQRAFLVGVFGGIDPTRDRVTATEILQRSQEVDAASQSLASTLMMTLQKPLVEAYMTLLDINVTLDGQPAIRPVIVAGSSKLSRVVQANALVASLEATARLNPTFLQRIDAAKIFRTVAQAQGIVDPDSYILPEPPPMTNPTNVYLSNQQNGGQVA